LEEVPEMKKHCTNKQWLPNGDKKDFLIFDFKTDEHSNIEFHEFNAAEDKAWPKDVITKYSIKECKY